MTREQELYEKVSKCLVIQDRDIVDAMILFPPISRALGSLGPEFAMAAREIVRTIRFYEKLEFQRKNT